MQDGDLADARRDGAAQRLAKTEISRDNLRRLVDHWEGLRTPNGLPARQDVRPEDLGYILSQIMLVDVHYRPCAAPVAAEFTFRFRLVGTRIEETGHPGLQGRWAHELSPLPYRRLVLQAYCEAVREAAPNFYRLALDHADQRLRYERVTLPLASDGRTVDTLLVGTDWDPVNEDFFRVHPAIG
jgi:hypothetical protein